MDVGRSLHILKPAFSQTSLHAEDDVFSSDENIFATSNEIVIL